MGPPPQRLRRSPSRGHRWRTGGAGSAAVTRSNQDVRSVFAHAVHLLSALCIGVASSGTFAQSVTLAGSMGSKALLVIDGQPHTLAVGQNARGVTLLQLSGDQARVQRGSDVTLLQLGAAPARLTGTPPPAATAGVIVLPVGLGGHFVTGGAINGRPVQFMVDTGASVVALSQTEAERIGLAWRNAPRAMTHTANGAVPVHRVNLNSVRVGEVEVTQVDAVVVPAPMPYVLLGNSFLGRFQMHRENDLLRLEMRR